MQATTESPTTLRDQVLRDNAALLRQVETVALVKTMSMFYRGFAGGLLAGDLLTMEDYEAVTHSIKAEADARIRSIEAMEREARIRSAA